MGSTRMRPTKCRRTDTDSYKTRKSNFVVFNDTATTEKEEKEADHHPYFRPKDAATLILIDRTGDKPKVLVGKRHDKVVFMPGKYVFPGGRVEKSDNRVPVAAEIPQELQDNLLK